MSELRRLRALMDLLSQRTWSSYEDGHEVGLEPGEEAVTDANLLDLHRSFPQLAVRRLTKQAEKAVGADWEWWIGSNHQGWLCLRIQAKRIRGTSYKELNHRTGDREYQYETLINSCRNSHFLPYHVFYNGWGADRFKHSRVKVPDIEALKRNPHWPHTDAPMWLNNPWYTGVQHVANNDERHMGWWGCAALSTHHVARIHCGLPKRRIMYAPRYLALSMPWSRLFAPVDGRSASHASLLDRVHDRLLEDTQSAIEGAAKRFDAPTEGLTAARAEFLREQRVDALPTYALAALSGQRPPPWTRNALPGLEKPPATHVIVTDVARF